MLFRSVDLLNFEALASSVSKSKDPKASVSLDFGFCGADGTKDDGPEFVLAEGGLAMPPLPCEEGGMAATAGLPGIPE